jgi:putative hydrolase of the HAD superfamily
MFFTAADFDALFLDLDDTILVFDGVSAPSWMDVCERYARSVGVDARTLFDEINTVAHVYWADPDRHREGRLRLDQTRAELVQQTFINLQCRDMELAQRLTADFISLREERIVPFEGALDALSILSSKFPLVLITNGESHKQRAKIDRFALSGYFTHILVEEEVGFGKPDVRIFEHACRLSGALASRCAMVGDNLVWDVQAPMKTGIYGIWHDVKGEGVPAGSGIVPDLVIRRLIDFAHMLS